MLENTYQNTLIEAGCDEAGRGCLAGSVFAAAVILPPAFSHPLLNDSKHMTERARNIEGMNIAALQLKVKPEFLAIDGNRFTSHCGLPYQCIVKGDGKYANIAAASVLAKTHRDEYMLRLHEEYPHYGWDRNKGYPTKEHRLAIREYGLTPYHRLSFNHLEGQLELF